MDVYLVRYPTSDGEPTRRGDIPRAWVLGASTERLPRSVYEIEEDDHETRRCVEAAMLEYGIGAGGDRAVGRSWVGTAGEGPGGMVGRNTIARLAERGRSGR